MQAKAVKRVMEQGAKRNGGRIKDKAVKFRKATVKRITAVFKFDARDVREAALTEIKGQWPRENQTPEMRAVISSSVFG
jgi:hypothetical protein